MIPFIDLGTAPPSNAYLARERLNGPEIWFPLRVVACTNCWLAQTVDVTDREKLFPPDYAYFSSYSTTWVKHADAYAAAMIERFALGLESLAIEVAANDGYLLQHFRSRGVPCLGIEPTASTAAAARQRGIEVIEEFFGASIAERLVANGRAADLIAANNVLAHVPDINDFVAGFAIALKPTGVATFEFPHLLRLVADDQFDTIYHEHFSYLSLTTVARIFRSNGLSVFDVEELPTHGGSLRVYAQRAVDGARRTSPRVGAVLDAEASAGVASPRFYSEFQQRAERIKDDFVSFLLDMKRRGKSVAAYGAAAKGNTLLNFAGVRSDLVRFVVDRNPAKQGKYLPGSRIPIVDEDWLRREKPDVIVILPWNLKDEIVEQLQYVRAWGGTFVTAISRLETLA